MSDYILLYRVQAADGRGPWRPGLSRFWVDEESDKAHPPDVVQAFGLEWKRRVPKGWWCGCACRTKDTLRAWFTPVERERLLAVGYRMVAMRECRVLVENEHQVVFTRRKPFNQEFIYVDW